MCFKRCVWAWKPGNAVQPSWEVLVAEGNCILKQRRGECCQAEKWHGPEDWRLKRDWLWISLNCLRVEDGVEFALTKKFCTYSQKVESKQTCHWNINSRDCVNNMTQLSSWYYIFYIRTHSLCIIISNNDIVESSNHHLFFEVQVTCSLICYTLKTIVALLVGSMFQVSYYKFTAHLPANQKHVFSMVMIWLVNNFHHVHPHSFKDRKIWKKATLFRHSQYVSFHLKAE